MAYIYAKPWCRIGPYIVGILAGYLLFITKKKIRMHWVCLRINTEVTSCVEWYDRVIGSTIGLGDHNSKFFSRMNNLISDCSRYSRLK